MTNLLVTQSFIVTGPETYWDYRDYIFCLCSNLATKTSSVRLNIEKGVEYADELKAAAVANGFTNIGITTLVPSSWKDYMLEQVSQNPFTWTMPWPGDHIYVHPDTQAFTNALSKAEELGADAVAYGHTQDFEYFLDWEQIAVLYNDPQYVLIEWGHKHRYRQNPRLKKVADKIIHQPLLMTPVPGFAVYKTQMFREVLEALPTGTKRWQDMEFSPAKSAWVYKLLIPKQCLYRHVHGYWLEGFLKYRQGGAWPKDVKAEIQSWYIKPRYNWRTNSPSCLEYLESCLQKYPYFKKYFLNRGPGLYTNEFGPTPFDANWKPPKGLAVIFKKVYKYYFYDPARRMARKLRNKLWTRQ